MSFEIRFFRENERAPLERAEVTRALEVLRGAEVVATDAGGVSAEVTEPATGAAFRVAWDREEPDAPRSFEDYADAGLRVRVGYCHPTFFTEVAVGAAKRLARELNLQYLDPASTEEDLPDRPPAEHSVRAWEIRNTEEVRKVRASGEGAPPWAPREALAEWARYQRAREEIESALEKEGSEVFVPQVILLRAKTGGQVVRMIPWPRVQRTVVPQGIDIVFLQRERAGGLFRWKRRKEHGAVSWSEVRPLLEPWLERRDRPVPHWIFRAEPPPPELVEAILDLPLVPFEGYEGVPAGQIVDVAPPRGDGVP